MQWLVGLLSGVLALLVIGSMPVIAQPSTPSGGGLTALPPTKLGPNLLQNSGFETLNGGVPVAWSSGAGWSVDQLVVHSGSVSYRRASGADTSAQRLQLKAGTYLLSAWIKTDGAGDGSTSGVRLTLDFRPGGVDAWRPSDVISGTNDWQLYQVGPIVVETDRTAAVLLENYSGAPGTAWFDDVSLVQILPAPVDVFVLYPNYRGLLFDDQPQTIQLDVTVTPPGGDFGRYTVRGVLSDETSGRVVAQRSFPAAAHLVAGLDATAIQSGRSYLAAVSLEDRATNSIVSTYPAYRVSKLAASARQSMNVSADANNRVVLKGVPRFVLGVYDSGLAYSTDPAFWDTTLWSPTGDRRLGGLNINLYLNYHYGEAPADAMAALMDSLQAHGVMYLQTGNCFDKYPADPAFLIESSDTYVRTLGAHAGSAGYYTADECLSSLQPGVFSQYQRLRALDPGGMTFAALLGDPDIVLWRDSADVLASDPYPLFGAEPTGGYDLGQVAEWTARTRKAVKDARPFMTVLQFFQFTSQGRFPTLAEMRNMAYMAIVEGAKGLMWWSLGDNALDSVCESSAVWCSQRTQLMNQLEAIVSEVASLEPVLLENDTMLPWGAVTSVTVNGAAGTTSSIGTKVKHDDKSSTDPYHVFAYNTTPYYDPSVASPSATAQFTLAAVPKSIMVYGENRTITPAVTATGATFTDTFGPFEAHVYVISY